MVEDGYVPLNNLPEGAEIVDLGYRPRGWASATIKTRRYPITRAGKNRGSLSIQCGERSRVCSGPWGVDGCRDDCIRV